MESFYTGHPSDGLLKEVFLYQWQFCTVTVLFVAGPMHSVDTYAHSHTHMHMFELTHVRVRREWYEPEAMMLSEEAIVVCGLLMGLNALDYNVMMSGEDFDKSVSLHLGHNSIHVQCTVV